MYCRKEQGFFKCGRQCRLCYQIENPQSEFRKTTAILCNSILEFRNWCKERNIKEFYKKNEFVDMFDCLYLPILKLENCHGVEFNDFYVVDNLDMNKDKKEQFINLIKSRIR